MVQTSFSANIALGFDQPIEVAVRQRADRAIWRDGEAQCKVLQGRARRRPRGAWREETDGGEVSPAGTGLSELRGTQGGRKARPSFGCTCTLSPTNEKLKNQGGNDFPSRYVTVRRPTQRPKQFLREEISPSGSALPEMSKLSSLGGTPPTTLHKDNVPAQLLVQRILTRPSEPCRANEPGVCKPISALLSCSSRAQAPGLRARPSTAEHGPVPGPLCSGRRAASNGGLPALGARLWSVAKGRERLGEKASDAWGREPRGHSWERKCHTHSFPLCAGGRPGSRGCRKARCRRRVTPSL